MNAKGSTIRPKELRRRVNQASPLQEACGAVTDELNELLNAATDARNRALERKIENLIGRFFDLQGELQGIEHELHAMNPQRAR